MGNFRITNNNNNKKIDINNKKINIKKFRS